MPSTRIVTGPILGTDGSPLPDFVIKFAVTKGPDGGVQYTPDGHYPWMETTVTTDENGDFALEMVTGITYAIQWVGAIQDDGRIKTYPPGIGVKLEFVVPHGETSISLQTIRALGPIQPDDPTVAQIIEAAVADLGTELREEFEGTIDTINNHIVDFGNPHTVTKAQVGLGDVENIAPADLPVSIATQDALNLKADASALASHTSDTTNPHGVTAAQAGAYTTGEVDGLVSGVDAGLTGHVTDMNNPHEVTASQLGLGNVANLAPADLPISTATQDALNLKADDSDLTSHTSNTNNPHGVTAAQAGAYTTSETDNLLSAKADTSSLGTAAAADVTEFATAEQGGKADTAVQPSTGLAEAIAQRHEHTNKAVLDTVATSTLVPSGGLRGQVLTMGAYGREWADVPGIVYPSLLLSPDGSFDRNGPVTPTVSGDVTVVAGRYGQAWSFSGGSLEAPIGGRVDVHKGTVVLRLLFQAENTTSRDLVSVGGTAVIAGRQWFGLQISMATGLRWRNRDANGALSSGAYGPHIVSAWSGDALRWDGPAIGAYSPTFSSDRGTRTTPYAPFAEDLIRIGSTNSSFTFMGMVDGIAVYPEWVPNAEIDRILAIPAAWTMANAAANIAIPNTFTPTNQTASGTTSLRTAPGTTAPLITGLVAGSLVQDTGGRVTESSVDYARVIGPNNVGTGWIPVSQLTAL